MKIWTDIRRLRLPATASVFVMIVTVLLIGACGNDTAEETQTSEVETESEVEQVPFDRTRWLRQEDGQYPFRAQMLDDVLYNDTIRDLSQSEVESLLGPPDRTTDGFAYYTIRRKQWGMMTLHATTMVIKYAKPDSIAWIKVHE